MSYLTPPAQGLPVTGPAVPDMRGLYGLEGADLGRFLLGTGISVAGRDDLARTARKASEQQMSMAALDALLPVPYGRVIAPGLIANIFTKDNQWIYWVIWCEGQVTAIENVYNNNEALQASDITSYLGTDAGNLDPTLVACFAAQDVPIAFAEKLPGVCFSVIRQDFKKGTTTPNFTAVIKGVAVFDPRDATQTYGNRATYKWSECPALITGDYIENTRWGRGALADWSSVSDAADFNDALVGTPPNTEKSRLCDLLVDREAPVADWLDTLRTAAACFLVEEQGVFTLIPDRDNPLASTSFVKVSFSEILLPLSTESASAQAPAPSAVAIASGTASDIFTFDHDSGDIASIGAPEIRSPASLPTVIEVTWMDASKVPWQDATTDPAQRPGVDSGATPYRKSVVDMRWITRATQATREKIERLNKLWLRSLVFPMNVFDEGLRNRVGDLVAVNYPDAGFQQLPIRIIAINPTDQGWTLSCEKHDAGAYSTTVQAEPSTPNTRLPLPSEPPAMGPIVTGEALDQAQNGYFTSHIAVSWDLVTWPFTKNLIVKITQGGEIKDQGPVPADGTSFFSKALVENLSYSVSVAIQSIDETIGTESVDTVLLNGKTAIPSDVPSFSAYEIGGTVRFNWGAATDLDLTGYEIRYGALGVAWANATFLLRTGEGSQSDSADGLPPGTYDFLIKALDSVRSDEFRFGQESANARRAANITVTSDATKFIAASGAFHTPTLTNMVFFDGAWITNFGESWNTLFPLAMTNYPKPVYAYHALGTSGLRTEAIDMGAPVTGDFIASLSAQAIDGTYTVELELSMDGAAWTPYTALPVRATARFARLHVFTNDGTLRVTSLGSFRCTVVSRSEQGTATLGASGPTQIVLAGRYSKVAGIQLTPKGTSARQAVYDNIIVSLSSQNSFDAYLFNAAGAQLPGELSYLFQGV